MDERYPTPYTSITTPCRHPEPRAQSDWGYDVEGLAIEARRSPFLANDLDVTTSKVPETGSGGGSLRNLGVRGHLVAGFVLSEPICPFPGGRCWDEKAR